jgi:hypothetical protein
VRQHAPDGYECRSATSVIGIAGLDLSNTARHRCSVTVNFTNTQRSAT